MFMIVRRGFIICRADNYGDAWHIVVGAVVGFTTAFVSTLITNAALGGMLYVFFDVIPFVDDKSLHEFLKESND